MLSIESRISKQSPGNRQIAVFDICQSGAHDQRGTKSNDFVFFSIYIQIQLVFLCSFLLRRRSLPYDRPVWTCSSLFQLIANKGLLAVFANMTPIPCVHSIYRSSARQWVCERRQWPWLCF